MGAAASDRDASFAAVLNRRGNCLRRWKIASAVVAALFAFLVVVYVSQSVAYRSVPPLNMRYDFPKMLFTPLNYCLMACYVVYLVRSYFSDVAANRFSMWAALTLGIALLPGFVLGGLLPLRKAVNNNIRATNAFFSTMQSVVEAGKKTPDLPIILEAHEPLSWAIEPVYSLYTYVRVYGAGNPISVRVHSGVAERFRDRLLAMQDGDKQFAPLAQSSERAKEGCISVGINGQPASECQGFVVRTD